MARPIAMGSCRYAGILLPACLSMNARQNILFSIHQFARDHRFAGGREGDFLNRVDWNRPDLLFFIVTIKAQKVLAGRGDLEE